MPAPDLIPLFVAPLDRIGLEYMITGAIAAILYGEPRLTNDIDLVVALDRASSGRLASAFPSDEFYVPPVEVIREEAARSRLGHFNLIHTESGLKADFYPEGQDALQRWGLDRRRREMVAGESVWFAPPEYVILRKLEFYRDGGSDKHLRDIRAMLRISEGKIDLAEIAAQSAKSGLTRQWEKALNNEDLGHRT